MCSGGGRGGGRAGDLPRGAVIAVSQHLNEGRIERSHGHGGKGEERLSLPSPDSPLSQPLPPSNSIQERRSRTMNTSQLLLKEEEAASAIGHTRRKGPAAAAASAFKGRTSWAEQGKRARRILNIILGISAQFLTFFVRNSSGVATFHDLGLGILSPSGADCVHPRWPRRERPTDARHITCGVAHRDCWSASSILAMRIRCRGGRVVTVHSQKKRIHPST